jgi:hypothetical protein
LLTADCEASSNSSFDQLERAAHDMDQAPLCAESMHCDFDWVLLTIELHAYRRAERI